MATLISSKIIPITKPAKIIFYGEASFSKSTSLLEKFSKFVIAGGGSGGITMASRILNLKEKDVTIIEPCEEHYYQPYWTLVGGKKKNLQDSVRPMSSIMPENVKWIKDEVTSFSPENNIIKTKNNGSIKYDYLIIALGLKLEFDKIKGLPDAFNTPGVCSNYSYRTVTKTPKALEGFQSGNAIFTQPINPIKCAGAPQKIMYLSEEYFKKTGKREKANIIFNTALGTIFSAPKYAAALREVAHSKNITVNYFHSLKEVKTDTKEAVFDILNADGSPVEEKVFKYEMLHITPPMAAPSVIKQSCMSDSTGFLDVNINTLQSKKFPNVFGLGDCVNVPTSKTAAAVAAQCEILTQNLKQVLEGKSLTHMYYGYSSCPLVTGYSKGILAEFDYELKPVETLPINQGTERYLFFYMKKDLMPFIYWNMMLKGRWPGPRVLRKIFHLGFV